MSSLPPALVGFQSQLEQAIRRERSRQSRRQRVLRVAVAGAAAALIALGVLSALPGDEPSLVERAAAAFAVDDDAILHFEVVARQTNPDGTVVTWSSESWQDRSAPFAVRTIETRPEGLTCASQCPPGPHIIGSPVKISVESAGVGNSTEIYDAEADTIYVNEVPAAMTELRPKISPGPRPGTSVVTVNAFRIAPGKEPELRRQRIVMSTEKAKRLIERQATAEAESAQPVEEPFRRQILRLLASDAVTVERVLADGREALRIASRDGRTTYLVDAGTYDPIELRTSGNGGEVTLTFLQYEELPRTAANEALLSLAAQHPTAEVNRDPAAYRDAEARLYPNG